MMSEETNKDHKIRRLLAAKISARRRIRKELGEMQHG